MAGLNRTINTGSIFCGAQGVLETIWLKPAPLRRLQLALVSTELLRYNRGAGSMEPTKDSHQVWQTAVLT